MTNGARLPLTVTLTLTLTLSLTLTLTLTLTLPLPLPLTLTLIRCQASCGGGSCPATVCKCGGAAHLAPDGSPTAPPGTNFKASCKSLHSERLTDDWCDSVCLAADGGQIDTAGGCDPEYCDCPWEQVASTPAEPVTVNRDGSINRGHGKPTPMGPRRFTKTDEKRQ
tara:strand:- start:208 stop:708 length:501 start_codon:yes stop_codon:yes gene_type:complete